MQDLESEICRLAERAVKFARESFDVELDYSPDSAGQVESMLAKLSRPIRMRRVLRLIGRGISDEQVWKVAFAWGAYLGVVMQRACGGEWSLDAAGGENLPVLVLGAQAFNPIRRVHARLTKGRDEDVWVYFNTIAQECRARATNSDKDRN